MKIRKTERTVKDTIHVELANLIAKQKREYSKIPPASAKKVSKFIKKQKKLF